MPIATAHRRTGDSSEAELAAEARALGLDAAAVEPGALRAAVQEAKARQWREENAEAIAQHEAWLVEHGHPLADYVDPGNPLASYLKPGPHWRRK